MSLKWGRVLFILAKMKLLSQCNFELVILPIFHIIFKEEWNKRDLQKLYQIKIMKHFVDSIYKGPHLTHFQDLKKNVKLGLVLFIKGEL